MTLSNPGIPSIRTKTTWHGLAQFLFACGALLLTPEAHAGSLMPPAGPVAPTMKKLSDVEPRTAVNATNTPGDAAGGTPSLFKISQSGSYYLTGNITGVSGKYGIEITASGVTLDLNGFDVVGVPGSQFGIGVSVSGLNNIAVVNGSVRSWDFGGVVLSAFLPNSVNCRVEGVLASGNGNGGITVGEDSTVSNCSAFNNTGGGIGAYKGCAITNCTAQGNTGSGITVGDGSTVTNSSAADNSSHGISAGNGCTISNSSASGNVTGIFPGHSSTVMNCSSYANTGNGILIGASSTVAGCSVAFNSLDGIQCVERNLIRDNICSSNGNGAGDGAGIHTTGNQNRIEGNYCTSADRGIDVDATRSIILKNSCSNNTTNWTIAANNVVGPILDRSAPASAAINGNSAPSSLGTTDPNANFTY